MENFIPARELLNPKFEGYKLDPISQEDTVARYSLEFKPTQATLSGKSTFSFQEVQSRITHNHISVCSEARRATYVDSQSRVILINLNAETFNPSFRVLYEMPTPVQSNAAHTREYPSTAFLTPTMIFVSDGHGLMYILQVRESGPSETFGIFTLSPTDTPFRIHSVHRTTPTIAMAILSSRHHVEDPDRSKSTDFNVWAIKIELLSLRQQDEVRQMNVIWHRRGGDIPIYTAYEESLKSFFLIGGTSYREDTQLPLSYEASAEEIVPLSKIKESFEESELSKPPPYSWTQTHDSVTVAFPLPSSTLKSEISVVFSPQTVTLHINSAVPASVPIPSYSAKQLWDGISASTSYWTWDREAEHTFGLLTLHLDKQHENTRWSQVFASAGTPITLQSNPEDIEVNETLDPSELWHIREALEKYTTALYVGDDSDILDIGDGIPGLAKGEIDMEVDESVGRKAYSTWVGEDGTIPFWWKDGREIPFQLLSIPLPGSNDSKISIVSKNNLDGVLFSIDPEISTPKGSPRWIHNSTFSALAFVLASKRDTRFTYHIPTKAAFAFESGARDRGGNVYIYRASPTNEKWAKQAILKVDDGQGGPLLGVGAVKIGQADVLLCLTEGELVIIKNLIE